MFDATTFPQVETQPLTLQQIYDRVKEHLLRQNAQSRTDAGCAYRGLGGLKCAVGCLIPDEKYTPEIEGQNPMHASGLVIASIPGATADHVQLLLELQRVHDDRRVFEWRYYLAACAKRFGLTP